MNIDQDKEFWINRFILNSSSKFQIFRHSSNLNFSC